VIRYFLKKAGFEWIIRRGMFEIWAKPVGLPSVDDHRGVYETYDESIFDCVATVAKIGSFNLTVEQGGNSWRIDYVAMTYTPYVYLKA